MVKRSKSANQGLTPGKAVMIGVLSVVLLVVLVMQFSGEKKEGVAVQPRARRSARESASSATAAPIASAPTTIVPPEKHWPVFDLAEVIAGNPFALPEVLSRSREIAKNAVPSTSSSENRSSLAVVESAEEREQLRRQSEFITNLRVVGVDMIITSPRGGIARIGDLSLRVGDIHEGLRVEAIGTDGVVFAPVTEGDSPTE